MKSSRLAGSAVALVALIATACGGTSPSAASSPSPGSAPSPSAATSAATVATAHDSKLGTILVDGKGITLYLFVADTSTASTCYTDCAQLWPPLLTSGAPLPGSGAQAGLLGTTTRTDGTVEVTYAGHPLYYFVQDQKPGETTGQGVNSFGGLWWAVAPSGAAIH